MLGITVIYMMLLGTFARRILGVRVGLARIVLAGVVALGAGIGFGTQVVWQTSEPEPGMIPVLIGIIGLVAVATLVIAEFFIPQGTIPQPVEWPQLLRHAYKRNQRYLQLLRIFARHRLFALRFETPVNQRQASERRRQAQSLRLALEQAGGAFVKLGQLLSTRQDILPQEFIAELEKLQQQVEPVDWHEIEPVLDSSLGAPHREVFTTFEQEPFAAASIGQVHSATMQSGQRVAVKIRRPGILALFERDLSIAQRLARRFAKSSEWASRFGIEGLVSNLTSSLQEELDYTLEAANIAALTEAQEVIPREARVKIPDYYAQLSSDKVLVMEHVSGATLSHPGALHGVALEHRQAMANRLLAATLAQIMEVGVFHSDLHPGNIIVAKNSLTLLDFGSIGRIDSETRSKLGEVLFAFSQRDSAKFTDALLEFVDLDEVHDEAALRRSIGTFMSRRLGPGAQLDPAVFSEIIAVLSDHGVAAPAELTVPFRSIATVEGSLRILDPQFDFMAEASGYAERRIGEAKRPSTLAKVFADELVAARPIVQRLPHRIDRITGHLAEGQLGFNMRMFAHKRDRIFLREAIGLGVVTFLAGIFGIMSALLLTSETGPQINETLTLFQVFGYLFLVLTGILTLRALYDVLRRQSAT